MLHEMRGAPELGVDKLFYGDAWMLGKGKPQNQITLEDVRAFARTIPENGRASIDLEGNGPDPLSFTYDLKHGLEVVDGNLEKISHMIAAFQSERPDVELGVTYLPFSRSVWKRPGQLEALAGFLWSRLETKPDVVEFDVYRLDPDRRLADGRYVGSDEAWQLGLRSHINAAKAIGLPLRVLMSPCRHLWKDWRDRPEFLPLPLFRADLMAVAHELRPDEGDRIGLWLPRNQEWDSTWDFHACLAGVEKAVLG